MPTYHGEEKCAHYVQVYACHPNNTEVLFKTEVRTPTQDTMIEELIDCIRTATDPRIRKMDTLEVWTNGLSELAAKPWTLTLWDDKPKYLLYKLWYDCICLKLGVMPQVTLVSDKIPVGMPEHWNFVNTRNPIEVECDNHHECGMFVNPSNLQNGQYNLAEEGHGYACCEACKNRIAPYLGEGIQYMHPDTRPDDPYEYPTGFEEQPNFNPYPHRYRFGVTRLTYNNQGQSENYTWA